MRLGIFGDIHGNALALEAVLAELEDERVDELICLGDVAVGPQPAEAIRLVRELGCPVILGNWDQYFARGFPEPADDVGQRLIDLGSWWAAQLSRPERRYLGSLAPRIERSVGEGVRLVAFHGSPRSPEEWILPTTPDDELDAMLDGWRAPIMTGGHTHFQLVRRHGDVLFVNPGSVGLPFARPDAVMRICPWAEYAIIEVQDGRLSVDVRRTGYDVDAMLALMRASGMPHADWWTGLFDVGETMFPPRAPFFAAASPPRQ